MQSIDELRQGWVRDSSDPELQALSRESDPGLFLEGVLALARRWESREGTSEAHDLYSQIAALPLQGDLASIVARAGVRRDALQSTSSKVEGFAKSLFEQAFDPTAVLGFGIAASAFKFTRLSLLARAALNPSTSPVRAFAARSLIHVAALGAESLAFTASNRGIHQLRGIEESQSAGEEMLSNAIFMGALKLSGATVEPLLNRLRGQSLISAASRRILPHLMTLGGIMAGHRAEGWAGLRPAHSGSQAWIDGLASFAHMQAGGYVANRILGPTFPKMEEEARHRTNGIERSSSQRLREFGRGFKEGLRNAHWNLFWGMMGAGGLGGGIPIPKTRLEPKDEAERVSRFLQPFRPRLEEAREAVEGAESPQQAWELLQNHGLIPEAWLDPMRSGFCFRKPGRGKQNIENLPPSIDDAVAIASDAEGIQTSFALIREFRSRMSLFYKPMPTLVVLNPTTYVTERLPVLNPYKAMPESGRLSAIFQRQSLPENLREEIRDNIQRLNLNFKAVGLQYVYESFLTELMARRESAQLARTLERSGLRFAKEEKQIAAIAKALGTSPTELHWGMLPDVWGPYLGIMDQGYLLTHSFPLKIREGRRKIMGNFLYVPPLE